MCAFFLISSFGGQIWIGGGWIGGFVVHKCCSVSLFCNPGTGGGKKNGRDSNPRVPHSPAQSAVSDGASPRPLVPCLERCAVRPQAAGRSQDHVRTTSPSRNCAIARQQPRIKWDLDVNRSLFLRLPCCWRQHPPRFLFFLTLTLSVF